MMAEAILVYGLVLAMFGQLLKSAESSTQLFLHIAETPN
jgi:hypothetical protein